MISAPPAEPLPPDESTLAEGPLHHRFAVGSIGFVPEDVLDLDIPAPRRAIAEDGTEDRVVLRRLAHESAVRQALIDGLGLAMVLGRISLEISVAVLRHHLDLYADRRSGPLSDRT